MEGKQRIRYGLPSPTEVLGMTGRDETKANFSRPITKDTGRVRAASHVLAQGARIISADGKVLAHGTSTIMVLDGGR